MIFFKKEKKKSLSLTFIAFLQALGLVVYCGLIGLLFSQGGKWFGPHNFLGPAFFLTLFVASALICALLTLGYPIVLFWEREQTIKALKLVVYTTAWLIFFVLLVILVLVVF